MYMQSVEPLGHEHVVHKMCVLRLGQKLKNSYLFFPLSPDKGQNQYIKGEFSPVEEPENGFYKIKCTDMYL